eukprot:CCRYP_006024-RA/>CCRYP_006024-RA protein AED:0.25 eAED:0.25 QI:0/-1/0/1/-1/1/1/0/206
MAQTFSSVKDFLDHHRQQRRSSLFGVDPSDISSATIAANGDSILTVRMSRSHQEEETVDTGQFSQQDMDRLRSEDPFLYYSIRKNKRKRSCCDFTYDRAADGQADVSAGGSNVTDHDEFDGDIAAVAPRRLSMHNLVTSTASRRETRRHSTIATTNKVKRLRRFSTETHPSLMYESWFAEVNSSEAYITLDDVEEEDLMITARSMI